MSVSPRDDALELNDECRHGPVFEGYLHGKQVVGGSTPSVADHGRHRSSTVELLILGENMSVSPMT